MADDEVRWFLCRTKTGEVLDSWTEPAPAESSWPPAERTDLPDPANPTFRSIRRTRRLSWWRRLIRTLMLIVALAVASACVPVKAPITVQPSPQTVVFGASITAQVTSTPVEDGDGRRWHARAGATIQDWAARIVDEFHSGPRRIVVADPVYNSLLDGWDTGDEAVVAWLVMAAQPDDCIVFELPWVMASAELTYPGVLANVNLARGYLERTADTFDWQPIIETDPTLVAADGLHLAALGADVTPVVEARYRFTEAGIQECER